MIFKRSLILGHKKAILSFFEIGKKVLSLKLGIFENEIEKSTGHPVTGYCFSKRAPDERKKQSCDLCFYQTQIGEVSSGTSPMIQTQS